MRVGRWNRASVSSGGVCVASQTFFPTSPEPLRGGSMQGLLCMYRGQVTGRRREGVSYCSHRTPQHPGCRTHGHGSRPGPRDDDARSHHVLGSPQESWSPRGPPGLEHQATQEEGDVEGPGRQDPGRPSSVCSPRLHLSFLCSERHGPRLMRLLHAQTLVWNYSSVFLHESVKQKEVSYSNFPPLTSTWT